MLVFTVIVTVTNAQTATFSTGSGTIVEHGTSYVLTNTTATWFMCSGYTDWITTQDYQCHIDSTSGNHTNVAVGLYGRKFSTD